MLYPAGLVRVIEIRHTGRLIRTSQIKQSNPGMRSNDPQGVLRHNISRDWSFIAILSTVLLWLHPYSYTMPCSM